LRAFVTNVQVFIALIKPEEEMSTYALADASHSVIIYATKTG
jgi:hypothetical protein